MSLLLDSRLGRRGGILPWTLLIIGAAASLAANIAVAEPTLPGRVIAAWPSFALTASYELLMRQVCYAAHRAAALAADEAEAPMPAECAEPAAAAVQLPALSQEGPEPAAAPVGDGPAACGGQCSGVRGSGRWPTGGRTDRFRRVRSWPGGLAAATGGAAWSPAWAVVRKFPWCGGLPPPAFPSGRTSAVMIQNDLTVGRASILPHSDPRASLHKQQS
jgi:hypothetical protein